LVVGMAEHRAAVDRALVVEDRVGAAAHKGTAADNTGQTQPVQKSPELIDKKLLAFFS